jgi:hypothetical protein
MYNPESGERFYKHKRRLKSPNVIMKNLVNQFYNKYNQNTMYIEI